jgi:hypothetical protein
MRKESVIEDGEQSIWQTTEGGADPGAGNGMEGVEEATVERYNGPSSDPSRRSCRDDDGCYEAANSFPAITRARLRS